MKKLALILIVIFLNVFLISCTSDDVLELLDSQQTEALDTLDTNVVATGGEDIQTPDEDDDDEDDEGGED
ncbi:hypothetical protein MWU59_12500 [Flavobacteriaceae bacterium F08102]|nr:hypothetical protein [Flavobacteriaceae bacterium F08102]